MKKFPNIYITFLIYALIGWLYEVLWMWFVVPPHHFINRGVLLGPFLPIYGFGMLILLFLLHKLMSQKHKASNPIYLSISVITVVSFIYTTIIEYTTTPKILHISEYLKDYGIGLLLVNVLFLIIAHLLVKYNKKIRNINLNIIIVFLLIWIITTIIEYVSHFAIDKFTGQLLWDYTKDFLNINARVNWDASRNFAIGGTFLLYVIQPLINKLLKILKYKQKLLITLIIGIPMLLDFIFHVILKLI